MLVGCTLFTRRQSRRNNSSDAKIRSGVATLRNPSSSCLANAISTVQPQHSGRTGCNVPRWRDVQLSIQKTTDDFSMDIMIHDLFESKLTGLHTTPTREAFDSLCLRPHGPRTKKKKNVLHIAWQPENYYHLTKGLAFPTPRTWKKKADGLYRLFEAGYHVYNSCNTLG